MYVCMYAYIYIYIYPFLFGEFSFEEPSLACKHPWYLQMRGDLFELSAVDDAIWIAEECSCDTFTLMVSPDFRERFCLVDVSQLRRLELSQCFPPPGTAQLRGNQTEERVRVQGGEFVCQMVGEDGQRCVKAFPTMRSLLLHQRRATEGAHSTSVHLVSLVITNQCAWCCSMFGSRFSAQQHVRAAFIKGDCKCDNSFVFQPS